MSIIFPVIVRGIKAWMGTHDAPHADEAGAWWLIQKFADPEFLAKYSVREVIRRVKYQIVWVGVGLGDLDEHNGKEGECAMSLVAKALGIYDYPPIKRIVDKICQQDIEGGGDFLGTIRLTNIRSRKNPQDPRKMLKSFTQDFDDFYEDGVGFYEAEKDFPKIVRWEWLIRKGKTIWMAVINNCDSSYMAGVALSKIKGAGIVVQMNLRGNTQIYTRGDIPLGEVYNWFRKFEQPDLWYLDLRKQSMLFNGSGTYPDVPPTGLTIEYIEQVIRHYLED